MMVLSETVYPNLFQSQQEHPRLHHPGRDSPGSWTVLLFPGSKRSYPLIKGPAAPLVMWM
jgi:hypothetical protein